MNSRPALLVSEIFPPHVGGSGRWFWEIYRRLSADEYLVAAGEHPDQAAFDLTHSLEVHRLPLKMREWGVRSWTGLRGYGKAIRSLHQLVRRRRIGMVHCGRCLPEGVMALALKWSLQVPYLCYVHGEDIGAALNSREHTLLVRRVLRGASCCIANSRNTKRLLCEQWGIPTGQVHILHPGADTKYFRPTDRDPHARRRLGWNHHPVLLTVGRLQRRKGQDMLIRALPAILRQVPGIVYAIAGDGEERESLQQLAYECGVASQVQFLGNISDAELLSCYQQCDLFALPNREVNGDIEGFGMVLIEAQACGKPVVAGRSGGTSETMRIGTTGETVDCNSPDALAERLVRLLLDASLRDEMGRQARLWVVEQFDWERLATKAGELFESQAKRQNKRKRALIGASGNYE
jgi:phosphatidylinositol alpha-1,6-mannosyltransferase